MHKLWLIIQREYLSRVRKRSFILTTLLTPLAFAVFFVVVGFIFSYKSDDVKTVVILDEGDVLGKTIKDSPNLYFRFSDEPLAELKEKVKEEEFDGVLQIPPIRDMYVNDHTIYYYSEKPPTPDIQNFIQRRVESSIREYKIRQLQLERRELDALQTSVSIDPEPLEETGENASKITSAVGAGIGTVMGIIMYMTVFIYGMMVMRSVMEEKTTRIVEVMISTVKPFQLMLGKIVGVGAVGLTQVAIWAILIPLVSMAVNLFFGIDPDSMQNMASGGEVDVDQAEAIVAQAMQELGSQNWWLILPLFVFYFLGGYFLYASLFAAVGSAMGDDMGEGQSLTLPISIPVILAFYIMFAAVQAPNSSLAVWSSIFPLFAPIVMPARLAFDPPVWEVVVSVILLAVTSVFFVWLSGRIYRVGILMYGKKGSFMELLKWTFSKE